MRFNQGDIEILTKTKNTNDSYKVINLDEICDADETPKFDNDIKWRKKFTKTQRDRMDESPARGKPPSMSFRNTHTLKIQQSERGAKKEA